ncbi:MAG: hypothetical protein U0Z70_20160 [Thermomicrobiales bacterium]
MRHIHDSRLQLRELHCAGLLDEAAQARLAAEASGAEQAPARLAAWRARLTNAWQALSHRRSPRFASAARPTSAR